MQNNVVENRIKLSSYYVAYLDILGIKNAINSDESENILNNIKNLYSEAIELLKANAKVIYFKDIKYKIFSDNIVIAIPKNDIHDELSSYYLMLFASFIQILGLKYSFLIRGSIAVDYLYIDNNFIYGKALTKTYELETNVSIYPRIVINPRDIHLFTKSDTQRDVIKKDEANIYYLNPFEFYRFYVGEQNLTVILKKIKENLELCLSNKNNDKINQKVCWFISMFNDFCKRNNFDEHIINVEDYPYPYTKIETIVTGNAREFI